MSAFVAPDFRLRILAGPVVVGSGRNSKKLGHRAAAAAAYLAAPPGRDRHTTTLRQVLWPADAKINSVQQIIVYLKKSGLEVVRHGDFYTLDLAPDQVDAEYFIQQTEDVTGLKADPQRLDGLLGLWQTDPTVVHEKYLSSDLWQRLNEARDRVVSLIVDADSDFRDGLRNLAEFRQVCDGRPKAERLKPRKRLLVVDDLHADDIALFLGSEHYEYQRIRTGREFWELVEKGPLRFDGAIVDRCLVEGTSDETGYDVLRYLLGAYPAVPRILISAHLGGPQGELMRELDLFEVFGKLSGGGLTGLSISVKKMVNRPMQR